MTGPARDGPVLVTGIGGMLGRAVAAALTSAGRAVVGMDQREPEGLAFPFLGHALPDPQRWHEAFARFGIRQVVHAGGVSGPMLMRDAPARLCDINLGGLVGLLEAARIHGLGRIVWYSSLAAYGPRPDLAPVDEDAPLRPDTVYGATKAAGEALISAYRAEHGVDAVALRVTSCYGPGRTTACLIRTLLEDAALARPTRVRDEPGLTRQHVYADDVVAATLAALDAPTLSRTSYNIGPGRTQTLDEIVEAARSVVSAIRVERDPDGAAWGTFPIGPLAIDAARRDLGFAPRTLLPDGIARTLDWVRERSSR